MGSDTEQSGRETVAQLELPGSQSITLPRGVAIIGRARECFLRIDDPRVSRQHLRLTFDGTLVAQDLGSQNGTCVNGSRIDGPTSLSDGDELAIGGRRFNVRFFGEDDSGWLEEVTPVVFEQVARSAGSARMGGTLMGIGAVSLAAPQHGCPNCGQGVSLRNPICPWCGVHWATATGSAQTTSLPEIQRPRRYARFEVSLPAHYSSEILKVEGMATDLSLGGAFVRTDSVDAVGVRCTLAVSANRHEVVGTPDLGVLETVQITGFVRHVIHRGRVGMGIEFSRIDDRQRSWLERQLAAVDRPATLAAG